MATPPKRIKQLSISVMSPDTEDENVSQFLQGMMNRMAVSYHKYGSISSVFPHRRTGVDNIEVRVKKYLETGNTEFLIDAANYALIEFLRPSVPGASFRATDSDESPGSRNRDGSVSHGKDDG